MSNKPYIVLEVAMEIAYSAELLEKISQQHKDQVARACAMSSSVGGIGPLLKERIAAQSQLGVQVVGVTLLYENVWVQGFYPWGQIYIQKKNVGAALRSILEDTGILLKIEMQDGSHRTLRVWKTFLHQAPVYLLDDPEIGSVVYPGPEDAPQGEKNQHEWVEKQKLKQYWLIGRGALALMKHLQLPPDFIIQSETPTFFANHFLIQDEFQKDPFFEKTKYIFNDHTPLEYAHPIWNEQQIQKARIDPVYAQDKNYLSNQRPGIDVTRLLIGVDHATYGVAKKHGKVMRAMPSLKGLEHKIEYITNGISVENWQHPDYKNALQLSDSDLIALKEKKKSELLNWMWKRYHLWYSWKKIVENKCFVLWTRRVTSYKRFDVLEQLVKNPELKKRFIATDLVVFVGGRIHQNDDLSQNVMFMLLDTVTRDQDLKDRIVVLDNYNIWDAPKLFSGVDATIMLADDGREASATGFMKAQVNGAVVIANSDGAIPESVYFQNDSVPLEKQNGFEVPYVNGQPTPEGLMDAFSALDRVYKDPIVRAKMVRASFQAKDQVSIDRTAQEMIKLFDRINKNK